MYGEYPNGDIIEIESHNIEFIEKEFPSIGEVKKNLGLCKLQEEITLNDSKIWDLVSIHKSL